MSVLTISEVCEENDLDEGAFSTYCENHHITEDYEEHIKAFTESYIGEYNTFLEYATEHFNDTQNVPEHLTSYIDYKKYAEDLRHSYWETDGYVFLNN